MPSVHHEFTLGQIALYLALTVVFVAINGFFVATEFALVKSSHARIDSLAAKGNKRAVMAQHILDHLDLYLSGCQLGITVASLVLGWLAEPAVAELLKKIVYSLGIAVNETALHAVSVALALTVVTMLHMIFGEQAPKIWAIHQGEKATLAFSYPLRLFVGLFRPLIWVINRMSNLVLRLLGITNGLDEETVHDIAEIRTIIAHSTQAGQMTNRQGELAQNILGLTNLEVRHILVPRTDVTILSLARSREENLKIIRESGHSRLPLCRSDLDSVLGMVHTRDLLSSLLDGEDTDLETLVRPAAFVPETQPLSRLIVELQSSRSGCAVVVDEHGVALGLAYMEDALEEIVGPIGDEFDQEPVSDIERPEPGVILIPGDLPLPEARDLLGLDELDGTDTIGGYVVSLLKRLPRRGDSVTLGAYQITVEDVTRRRATRLRFVDAYPPNDAAVEAKVEE